jgi:membrane protease YdiL (CAAX protease family)
MGSARRQITRKKLAVFLSVTAVLSAVFHVLIARSGTMRTRGGLYAAGLMWSPGVAAIVTQLVTEGTLRGMGWRWGKSRYQLLSIGVPLGLVAVTYGVVVLTGLGGFPNEAFLDEILSQVSLDVARWEAVVIYATVSATFGLLTSSLTALGEEIGWRGLLVPELARMTDFTRTGLISGVIWSVYHYPGILFADYHGGGPLWYSVICFTVMAIAFSFVMAWIRLKSGSVWTAMFAHAAHNVFVQTIFNPLVADTGPTKYLLGEFGVGLPIAYLVAAFIFWRMRGRLPEDDIGVLDSRPLLAVRSIPAGWAQWYC